MVRIRVSAPEEDFSKSAYRNIIQITIKLLVVVRLAVMRPITGPAPNDIHDLHTTALAALVVVTPLVAAVVVTAAPHTVLTAISTAIAVLGAQRLITAYRTR